MRSAGISSILAIRYPGIEFRQKGFAQVDAEADVLIILRTGGLILGECKTNARGLTPEELDKLWKAGDSVGARATFAATLDRASNCGPLWRETLAPNGKPHFALTAEHLLDLHIRGSVGSEDIFEWRDHFPAMGGIAEPPDQSTIDKAFSDYVEGSSTDYNQLGRAPWMDPDFIDPVRMADQPDDADHGQQPTPSRYR